MPAKQDIALRFFDKVSPEPNSGCWLWDSAVNNKGYGLIFNSDPDKERQAHRVSWRLHRGEIPTGMCVLHRCDVPLCVNQNHLFLGTMKDNTQDMIKKGRAKGGPIKHSNELVREIKQSEGTYTEIAKRVGIDMSYVRKIKLGQYRAGVT
jgi:hypothetical protein